MSISVIIPVYNAEKYIGKCLETLIVARKNCDLEIVLINDGSLDASLEICRDYTQRYSFISVFNQQNSGPSFARNKGIEKATNDFLVFVDADDYVDENYLIELYNSIKDNDSDLACCGYFDHSGYGTFEATNYGNESYFYGLRHFVPYVLDKVGGVVWDKIFKREIIVKNKINFNTSIQLSEDLLFVLEYLKHIYKISIVQKHLYHYNRLDQSGLSKNYSIEQFETLLKVNDIITGSILNFNQDLQLYISFLNKRKYSFVIHYYNKVIMNHISKYKKKSLLEQIRLHDRYDLGFNLNCFRLIDFPVIFLLNFKMYSLVLLYGSFLNRIKPVIKKK